MKLSWLGGTLFAVHVWRLALKVWLAFVRRPLSSSPPTVKMFPLPSSIVVGYQRAIAMFGSGTYFCVLGSNRYDFAEPALALFVAAPGYAVVPPATRSSPSGRNAWPE